MADMRKCIGSAKFGIKAHEAPVGDFPTQPSQKDGLGRMCKPHWGEYTNALRKAALARKAAPASVAGVDRAKADKAAGKAATAALRGQARGAKLAKKPEPIRTRPARGRKTEGEQIVDAVDAAIAREAAKEASIA